MSKGFRAFEIYLNDDEGTIINVKIPSRVAGLDIHVDEDTILGYAYNEGHINEDDLDYIDYIEEVASEGHFDIVNNYI